MPEVQSRSARIPFAAWGAISREQAQELALHGYTMPLEVRIMFLAMAFSNRINHATFDRGQITQLLEQVDPKTGELRTPTAKTVREAIKRAINQGLLAGQTGGRCLVLPGELWAMQAHTSSSCDYCGVGFNARKRQRLAS
jgi:hypothetical protein